MCIVRTSNAHVTETRSRKVNRRYLGWFAAPVVGELVVESG